jgi:hypothetical protein
MTDGIDHARTAEIYGEFTQRESAIIAAFERAAVPFFDSLDVADSRAVYDAVVREHGAVLALDLCRRNRYFLDNIRVCVDELRAQLTDGGAELSAAAGLFLAAQADAYEVKKAGVERGLLDFLLGNAKP